MTLPASGAISLNDVNVELDLSATAQIGMNDAAVRDLFDVPSGAISMSDGYGKSAYYTIARGLRFRSSATAYLNRTPGTAGNQKTWTWSAWVKRGSLGVLSTLFASRVSNNDSQAFGIYWGSDDKIGVLPWSLSFFTSNAVFRDPSAWYHFVVAFDSTQATATNRVKVYANGVALSGTYPLAVTLNADYAINQAGDHRLGDFPASGFSTFDGYMTEINFIDGQALDPTYFGEYNANIGAWQPIEYSGSYGTNGFYLNFSNNANTTALGYDYSGNGNNWTTNNISLTNNYTYDSLKDVPTLTSSIAANYAVLNPLTSLSGRTSFSAGNLQVLGTSSLEAGVDYGTIGVTSGKWYWESTILAISSSSAYPNIGAVRVLYGPTNGKYVGDSFTGGAGIFTIGSVYKEGSFVTTVSTYTTNDVIGVALDLDNLTCAFYKNGTLLTTVTGLTAGTYWAGVGSYYNSSTAINFGASEFAYSVPSGFKRLNTYNLPDSTIVDGGQYFNTVLYTGNGGNLSITGVGFRPDFVWGKLRSTSSYHRLHDVLRGSDNTLASNVTDAEVTGNGIVSFDSDGFTMDSGTNINQVYPYVAWNWKANGAGVSNGSGSITSTVSANTTAGFSVVTYTGTGANATVGHGLGVAPSMIIVKVRSTTSDWVVYSADVGNTKYLQLSTTAAAATASIVWNNTTPTSTVFSLGSSVGVNQSTATYVAYCFAEVEGYSKFGSYTGNGSSNGTFVYLGFRPAFVMIKGTASSSWYIWDSARNAANEAITSLYPNLINAEGGSSGLDLTSNGFKVRTTGTDVNTNGNTMIFMAFAESPFKNSLAR